MWIFLNNAFLSMVEHREQPDKLMVRARCEGDIQRVFGEVLVTETPAADYRFRTVVHKATAMSVISGKVLGINYDNFKNSVAETDRHHAYAGCWHSMYRLQTDRQYPTPVDTTGDMFDDISDEDFWNEYEAKYPGAVND